jgi:hypothetical protein
MPPLQRKARTGVGRAHGARDSAGMDAAETGVIAATAVVEVEGAGENSGTMVIVAHSNSGPPKPKRDPARQYARRFNRWIKSGWN